MEENGYMYMYGWVLLLSTWNYHNIVNQIYANMGLPRWFSSKESACNAEDQGSIPGQEDPLGKGTATHSSILAWRIPWTEEPWGL